MDDSDVSSDNRDARDPPANATIDSLVDTIAVVDADGTIVAVNRAWREFGASNEAQPGVFDPVGLTYLAAVGIGSDDETDTVVSAVRDGMRAVRDGATSIVELDYRCDSPQQRRWFHLTITKLAGSQQRVVMCHHDITASKIAELDRVQLESQRQQSAKLEAIGRLAGGIAHELNNKLGIILGRVEYAVSASESNNPILDDLVEIRTAAERSARLTRQLLTFARQQSVDPKTLDVNEIIAGRLPSLTQMVGDSAEIKWIPGSNLWTVRIDLAQLDLILISLCLNAREALDELGTIEIETANVSVDPGSTSRPEVVGGDYVRITVRDNGCGIKADDLPKIFDPFFTTKLTGSGVGLGLASVHGAVTQNHGFVVVSSEVTEGATFEINLRRHDAPLEAPPAGVASGGSNSGQATVLLVEDEPALLRLMSRVLEEEGYTILAAGNAEEATILAKQHADRVDLLVTDIVLPGLNGRELADELAASGLDMPNLFLSGYTANVFSDDGAPGSHAHFIAKPFAIDDFVERVGSFLTKSQRCGLRPIGRPGSCRGLLELKPQGGEEEYGLIGNDGSATHDGHP